MDDLSFTHDAQVHTVVVRSAIFYSLQAPTLL